MRGAACGDLHLGYRAYSATDAGRNVRELDVERAWSSTVDAMIDAGVDLVTVAGDVFDHPRVGVHALKAWRDGVKRIVDHGIPVVAIPGNHDAGRTADTLSPTTIPDDLCHVVTRPERVVLTARDGSRVAVTCLPYAPRVEPEAYRLEPLPDVDVNVLLLHAAVKSSALKGADRLPLFYHGERALDVGKHAEGWGWNVIHAGDWHGFLRLHPERLAFYPGAIERVSSNPWQESPEKKGWVLYDTSGDELVHNRVEGRPFDVWDLDFDSADKLNRYLEEIRSGEVATIDGHVVRLRVSGIPRVDRDRIEWASVRELKRRATHFRLEVEYDEGGDAAMLSDGEDGAVSVADALRAFMADDAAEVRDLAVGYVEEQAALKNETAPG